MVLLNDLKAKQPT